MYSQHEKLSENVVKDGQDFQVAGRNIWEGVCCVIDGRRNNGD